MRPVRSHNFSVLSLLPESPTRPSGEKATELTAPVWPEKLLSSRPDAMSHSLNVLSRLPENTAQPLGEKATDSTPSVCPSKLRSSRPDAMSHSFNMPPALPESAVRPSCEMATAQTPLCVAREAAKLAARRDDPQFQRLVSAARKRGAAIGRNGDRPDKVRMAREAAQLRGPTRCPTVSASCPNCPKAQCGHRAKWRPKRQAPWLLEAAKLSARRDVP